MTKLDYHQASFLTSAAELSQLPPDEGIEVAFVGRSNAGKSSVLNRLTQNKKLARVSKTPGRTRLINLFTLDKRRRLVDLPGYGYAKVAREMKLQWQDTLGQYLDSRECLKGLVVVMDIRHPLTDFDKNLLDWASHCELSVHILLNKSDKLAYGARKKTLLEVEKYLQQFENPTTCQIFSAAEGDGAELLTKQLGLWFEEISA